MLCNSFKFLSLALAASLTVAPVSAIDWNSNSTRLGLAGLAVVGIAYIAYKYWVGAKNAPKAKNTPKQTITSEEKQKLHDCFDLKTWEWKDIIFLEKTLAKLQNTELTNLVNDYRSKKSELSGINLQIEELSRRKIKVPQASINQQKKLNAEIYNLWGKIKIKFNLIPTQEQKMI